MMFYPSQKQSKLDEPDMWDTGGEVRTNSLAMCSSGPLHTDEQALDDQLEPIYSSSVRLPRPADKPLPRPADKPKTYQITRPS